MAWMQFSDEDACVRSYIPPPAFGGVPNFVGYTSFTVLDLLSPPPYTSSLLHHSPHPTDLHPNPTYLPHPNLHTYRTPAILRTPHPRPHHRPPRSRYAPADGHRRPATGRTTSTHACDESTHITQYRGRHRMYCQPTPNTNYERTMNEHELCTN